ncbi:hypothetical protein SCHPADRAFT_193780 [Schizopora paradoxa]|uniref:Transmembrane protein n=1 Tax=Schizopora paradoxa TaxID=27342 RepID=A0A0H2SI87_9AGAM|nr:hypothetical protein SCHPADRAFT_193780 [Schizopora paradoxa]
METGYSHPSTYRESSSPMETCRLKGCFRSAISVIFIDIFAFAFGSGLVLFQLIRLWSCGKGFGLLIALGWILTNIVTVVCSVLITITLKDNHGVAFFNFLVVKACDILSKPRLIVGCYIPAVVLEVYSFALLCLNTASRPRAATQRLVSLLYKDGVVFFLVTLSTRLLNLILNISAPTSLAVLGISFGASLYSVSVARLHLRMSAISAEYDEDSLYEYEDLIQAHDLQDCVKKRNSIPLKQLN